MFQRRAADFEVQLRDLTAQKLAALSAVKKSDPLPTPEDTLESAVAKVLSATDQKQPKVRDAVLDRLRIMAPEGQKAAALRLHLDISHSMRLHEKTVGMTLYRLSQEGLVHRKGQTWFYGPQAGQSLPASAENPGDDTPGDTHEVS